MILKESKNSMDQKLFSNFQIQTQEEAQNPSVLGEQQHQQNTCSSMSPISSITTTISTSETIETTKINSLKDNSNFQPSSNYNSSPNSFNISHSISNETSSIPQAHRPAFSTRALKREPPQDFSITNQMAFLDFSSKHTDKLSNSRAIDLQKLEQSGDFRSEKFYLFQDNHQSPLSNNNNLFSFEHSPTFNQQQQQIQQQQHQQLQLQQQPSYPPQKRRRVINLEQRKAANVRERKRMDHLNKAFDSLRNRVPTFEYEKKLSRIDTLRLATDYIAFLASLLHASSSSDVHQFYLPPQSPNSSNSNKFFHSQNDFQEAVSLVEAPLNGNKTPIEPALQFNQQLQQLPFNQNFLSLLSNQQQTDVSFFSPVSTSPSHHNASSHRVNTSETNHPIVWSSMQNNQSFPPNEVAFLPYNLLLNSEINTSNSSDENRIINFKKQKTISGIADHDNNAAGSEIQANCNGVNTTNSTSGENYKNDIVVSSFSHLLATNHSNNLTYYNNINNKHSTEVFDENTTFSKEDAQLLCSHYNISNSNFNNNINDYNHNINNNNNDNINDYNNINNTDNIIKNYSDNNGGNNIATSSSYHLLHVLASSSPSSSSSLSPINDSGIFLEEVESESPICNKGGRNGKQETKHGRRTEKE